MDENKKLNKYSFILLSLGLSVIVALIVALAIVLILGISICITSYASSTFDKYMRCSSVCTFVIIYGVYTIRKIFR